MFKKIEGHKDYGIDENGTVVSFKSSSDGKIISQFLDKHGYLQVNLYKENHRKHLLVSRLVALTYIPNPEAKPQVNHKDGNKINNNISNLEWCTGSENVKHSFDTGLQKKKYGSESNNAKLNKFQVQRMRLIKEISPSITFRELGNLFSLTRVAASNIIRNKTWNLYNFSNPGGRRLQINLT